MTIKNLLIALCMTMPVLANAKCDCKTGRDELIEKDYYEVICHRNEQGLPNPSMQILMVDSDMTISQSNVRVVGFDNQASAMDNMMAFTRRAGIKCN